MTKKLLLQDLSETPGHSSIPVMHTLRWVEKKPRCVPRWYHTKIMAQTAFEAWRDTWQVHRCPFHLVEFST